MRPLRQPNQRRITQRDIHHLVVIRVEQLNRLVDAAVPQQLRHLVAIRPVRAERKLQLCPHHDIERHPNKRDPHFRHRLIVLTPTSTNPLLPPLRHIMDIGYSPVHRHIVHRQGEEINLLAPQAAMQYKRIPRLRQTFRHRCLQNGLELLPRERHGRAEHFLQTHRTRSDQVFITHRRRLRNLPKACQVVKEYQEPPHHRRHRRTLQTFARPLPPAVLRVHLFIYWVRRKQILIVAELLELHQHLRREIHRRHLRTPVHQQEPLQLPAKNIHPLQLLISDHSFRPTLFHIPPIAPDQRL